MSQHFIKINGAVDVPSDAKKIIMTALDDAIAAFPGLVHDLDIASLVTKDANAYLGYARKSGSKLLAQGPGYSLVNSAYLNNKPAVRLTGATGHWLRLPRGISKPDFTLIAIATIGPEIRSSSITSSRPFLNIYDGTTPIVWTRFAANTSNLQFSTTSAATGAQIVQGSLPAADTGAIWTFSRNDLTDQNNINIDGVSIVSATDTFTPPVTPDKRLNIGAPDGFSPTRGFYGDIARIIAVDTNVVVSYPELFANFIAAAKAEYDIA